MIQNLLVCLFPVGLLEGELWESRTLFCSLLCPQASDRAWHLLNQVMKTDSDRKLEGDMKDRWMDGWTDGWVGER